MIPARFAQPLFAFFLSCMMSFIISGISTYRALGPHPGFLGDWLGSWAISWAIAFPTVLFVAPLARKIVAALTR
jgi:hypothetical protein